MFWTQYPGSVVPLAMFGPPTMVAAVFDFKNLGWGSPFYEVISQKIFNFTNDGFLNEYKNTTLEVIAE